MDMKRHDFESSIKGSDSYAKLIYMHGEKLFIFDDGKYKIAAMQLAWEIYCDRYDEIEGLRAQQAKVEELEKDLEESALSQMKFYEENNELQKRVDAAIEAINEHYESDGMSGLYFMDLKEILEAEQALKGEG